MGTAKMGTSICPHFGVKTAYPITSTIEALRNHEIGAEHTGPSTNAFKCVLHQRPVNR